MVKSDTDLSSAIPLAYVLSSLTGPAACLTNEGAHDFVARRVQLHFDH
jgi:hypothetical protein